MVGILRFISNMFVTLIVVQELFFPELLKPWAWYKWVFLAIGVIIVNYQE